ncbi:MAG: hypothetical protein JWM46_439 [Candidatus Kaiserbacteria bacterium]|nr:hypothetical protein [Candidatus Kaiserbacteria bacterium]
MYSRRNTFILIAAAALVAFVVGYISYTVHKTAPATSYDTATSTVDQNVDTQTGMDADITALTYTSSTYGITFNYPSNYTLSQKDVKTDASNKVSAHHAITLVSNSAKAVNNGEGPTAITIDIYPNPKKLLVQDWIKNTDASNYKLAVDPKMQDALVGNMGGTNAYAYTWSGLYNGNSFVFTHKNNIVMASVTYLTTKDVILNDFIQIMSTLRLK